MSLASCAIVLSACVYRGSSKGWRTGAYVGNAAWAVAGGALITETAGGSNCEDSGAVDGCGLGNGGAFLLGLALVTTATAGALITLLWPRPDSSGQGAGTAPAGGPPGAASR